MNRLSVGADACEVEKKTSAKRHAKVAVFVPSDGSDVDWWFAFSFATLNTSNRYWLLKVDKRGGGGWTLQIGVVSCERRRRYVTLRNASLGSISDLIQDARRRTWRWVDSDDEDDMFLAELPLSPVDANIDVFRTTLLHDLHSAKQAQCPVVVATKK